MCQARTKQKEESKAHSSVTTDSPSEAPEQPKRKRSGNSEKHASKERRRRAKVSELLSELQSLVTFASTDTAANSNNASTVEILTSTRDVLSSLISRLDHSGTTSPIEPPSRTALKLEPPSNPSSKVFPITPGKMPALEYPSSSTTAPQQAPPAASPSECPIPASSAQLFPSTNLAAVESEFLLLDEYASCSVLPMDDDVPAPSGSPPSV